MTKSRGFDKRVTVRMTEAMLADLQTVATKQRATVPAIARQAIRNYLDDTDLTLGTRRTFDRRFQRRMDMLEEWLVLLLVVMSRHFARDYDGKSGGHLVKDVLESDFPQMVEAAREMLQKSLQKEEK
jgi:hypothetical protein